MQNREVENQKRLSVSFADVTLYRKHIGTSLLKTVLQLAKSPQSAQPFYLEIGPGAADPLQQVVSESDDLLKFHQLYFVEPDPQAAENLLLIFNGSKVYNQDFQSFLSNRHSKLRKFDIVFAHFSLHWVSDFEKTIQDVARLMNSGGLLGLTITDTTRSFWSVIDQEIESELIGCSLFKSGKSHSTSPDEWRSLFESERMSLIEKIDVVGRASLFENEESAIQSLKKAAGLNYAKTTGDVSIEVFESVLKSILTSKIDSKLSGIPVPASACQFIFRKN